MSYIRDNLMPKEKILLSARVHPAIFVSSVTSLVMTIIIFALAMYSFSFAVQVRTPNSPPPPIDQTAVLGWLVGLSVLCISGALFFSSILLGLQAAIVMLTTEFAVTNRRVIAKTGFIRRHTLEMLLSKVESVAVHQGILGRLLNFGTVTVIGTGGTRESFTAISEPTAVRSKINQILESYMQAYAQYQQNKSNSQSR